MNKKALSLAITLAMAFPAASHALGLGDIQSNSHLNQPFKGKIPVLSATPAEARNIRVKIASPAVFNRVGIDRPAFLNSIRFRPAIENGKPVILVSSTQPIHEPFVNFLLEVNWPKGQLLKEYTALLDPPVLMQPGTAIASNRVGVRAEPGAQRRINRPAAQQPRRVQPQRRIVRAPAPQARRAAPPRQRPLTELQRAARALGVTGNRTAARATPARGTKTYRVKRGDYLYKVAKKLGYRGVRNEQMMMALFEANPQAFDGSNVNNLKAGALMRRPTAQQAKGITYRTARRQLASHTKAWKKRTQVAGNAKSTKRVAKNTQAAPSTAKNGANTQAHMVVSGSADAKANGSGAAGNASVTDLKQKLVLASESLTSKSNENSELKSRVAELESLLRKKNRLITLKSEQLAELQARVGGGEVSPGTEPETEVVQTESEEPISTEVGGEGEDIQAQVANQTANENGEIIRTGEVDVEPEVEAPVAAIPKVVAKQKPQPEDEGILGLLGDPMVTGIGGGSLLALLGGLWFMRRRKNTSIDDDEEYADFALDQELAQSSEFGDEDLDLGLDQAEVGESKFTEADFGVDDGMFGEQTTQQPEAKVEEESGESKEENILQEADVYLVYGLHDQAEAELRKAIEEEPDNLAYRAKLIENFKAAGDKKNFEKEVKTFKSLEGNNKEKLWNDIVDWGKSFIPDSNLFTAKSAVAGAVAAATGIAITAGNASPEENVDVDFSNELENTDDLEELDSVLDDDFSIDIDDMLDDDIVSKDAVGEVTDVADSLDINFENTMTDLNENVIVDDVIETDISDSLDLDLGLDNGLDMGLDAGEDLTASVDSSLSEDMMEVDLDSTLDISNFETDLGSETIATEAEKVEESMDGLDLDFDLGLDDKVASVTDTVSETVEEKLDMPNLNLDIDANDFDKIMPENHAYKKVETVAEEVTESEDNLLADFDDNLSFLDLEEDSGEVIEETQIGTKLDLAKAYIDMGDIEGARSTLEEVIMEGNDEQKKEAEELLHQTG